jgi:hypothetical protein
LLDIPFFAPDQETVTSPLGATIPYALIEVGAEHLERE